MVAAQDPATAEGFGDRAAHARLVALERDRNRKYDDAAALITYHETTAIATTTTGHRRHDGSSSSSTLPPWARAAERIALALTGLLPTVLATNSQDVRLRTPPFSRVLRVDLLKLSGLDSAVPARAMCGLKITALLHGWQTGALPARTLVLDHDVILLRPRQLVHMLDPLHHCASPHCRAASRLSRCSRESQHSRPLTGRPTLPIFHLCFVQTTLQA